MLGAIIGDIVGSTFESENHRSPFFELFRKEARFTDDTVCLTAVAEILERYYPDQLTHDNISNALRIWCCTYFNRGFGSIFQQWIINGVNTPYNSYGNNALMRISPVAYFAVKNNITKEEALSIAEKITVITHNHPDAVNSVKCYIDILYTILAYKKNNNNAIELQHAKEIIVEKMKLYNYEEPLSIKKYRVTLDFDLTCKTSLSVAVSAILETENFDDVLYQVVSVGGDSDTYAAIAGAIAESIYGIPEGYLEKIKPYFREYDKDILEIINNLYSEEVPEVTVKEVEL